MQYAFADELTHFHSKAIFDAVENEFQMRSMHDFQIELVVNGFPLFG